MALGRAHALAGQKDEALASLDELNEISRRRFVSRYFLAQIHRHLGETGRAFELLERAYEERDSKMVYLELNPNPDGLRKDERVAATLQLER